MQQALPPPEYFYPSFLLDYIEQKVGSGVQIIEVATRRLFWSEGLHRLFGLNPLNSVPSADVFNSLIHPSDLAFVTFGTIAKVINDGLPQKIEFRFVRRDMTMRWISCATEALHSADGENKTLVSVFVDITEHKASTEQARRNDLHRTAVLSMLSSMTWIVGSDGVKQDLPQWRAKTGMTIQDSRGSGWIEAIHPDDRERVTSLLRDAYQFRHEYNARYRLRHSNGDYRLCIARVTPHFDSSGHLNEWHGVWLDIEDIERRDPLMSLPASARPIAEPVGAHIRAARAALNWSVKDLAAATNLTSAVIRSIEDTTTGPISSQRLAIVVTTLKQQGIEFCAQDDGRVAVVLA